MSENQPEKTSLIDHLRSIPKELRAEWESQWNEDGRATGHRMAPIGIYAQEAAKIIIEQTEDIAELVGILKISKCPTNNCDSEGVIFDGENMEPCQWCDTKNRLVAKHSPQKEKCEHGEGLTDYCLPCGRINGESE